MQSFVPRRTDRTSSEKISQRYVAKVEKIDIFEPDFVAEVLPVPECWQRREEAEIYLEKPIEFIALREACW